MHAYVLNFEEMQRNISYVHRVAPSVHYSKGAGTGLLPGSKTRKAYWICHGNVMPHLDKIGKDPIQHWCISKPYPKSPQSINYVKIIKKKQ